jgi:hypothetical protein
MPEFRLCISPGDVAMAVATKPLRSSFFQPTPGPFDATPIPDVGMDTMLNQSNIETVFADTGWKNTTLKRLCDVEDLLDCLEASGYAEREVETRGNASFAVRWR